MKKRKVLIVNNMIGYYGAENVLVNMVNNMDYSRYDITVLTLLECDSTQLNNEIHYKYIFRKKNEILHKVKNKLKLILSYKNLAKIYCRGFDIAIAFKMGECAHLVSFCNAPKKICWIHSNVTDIPENFSYSFSSIEDEKECMRKFDILVAVSHSCANSFTQKYGKSLSIIVVYNPIDSKKIHQLSKLDDILQDDKYLFDGTIPVLGTIARIDYQKGIDRLIYISEKLEDLKIKHRMVIIGDGVDFKKYSKIIQEKKLKSVYLLGFRKNPYAYLIKFRAFICSSICESYSLVVNEALVLGIPVISTKCGGPEEVLQNGKYGILTENNEEALFFAVRKFLLSNNFTSENYDGSDSLNEFIININKILEMN